MLILTEILTGLLNLKNIFLEGIKIPILHIYQFPIRNLSTAMRSELTARIATLPAAILIPPITSPHTEGHLLHIHKHTGKTVAIESESTQCHARAGRNATVSEPKTHPSKLGGRVGIRNGAARTIQQLTSGVCVCPSAARTGKRNGK